VMTKKNLGKKISTSFLGSFTDADKKYFWETISTMSLRCYAGADQFLLSLEKNALFACGFSQFDPFENFQLRAVSSIPRQK
jgi:hypothetical protein